jgi:hypothetical protein
VTANAVEAAPGSAMRDVTGLRLYETPFTADRLYSAAQEKVGDSGDEQISDEALIDEESPSPA